MLTIADYCSEHPAFAFDFSRPIAPQTRMTDPNQLAGLPDELAPEGPYTKGSRGRPNRNQTRTHKQCGACHRLLRNDLFWNSPSMLRNNIIATDCIECSKAIGHAADGEENAGVEARRLAIGRYISPRCMLCGFAEHPAAMEMHALAGQHEVNNTRIAGLVAQLAAIPSPRHARSLIAEAAQCVALCANCHRLLHAGAVELPADAAPLAYDPHALIELMRNP